MRRPGRILQQVLRSVVRKPATVRYPMVKVTMPDRFRGELLFHPDRCIGCRLCMRDCPTNAMDIRKVADRQFEADLDLARCIYCAQCVDSCPKKALEATGAFELAELKRGKLKVSFRAEPKAAPDLDAQTANAPAVASPAKSHDTPEDTTDKGPAKG